jgi:hypothetical protein
MSINFLIVSSGRTDIESVDCFLRSSFLEHYFAKQMEKHLLAQPVVCGRRAFGWLIPIQIFEIRAVKHALLQAVETLGMR